MGRISRRSERALNIFQKKLGLYNLRDEGVKWVIKNFGHEYVQEFLDAYDKYEKGLPIGEYGRDTQTFKEMLEAIKEEM